LVDQAAYDLPVNSILLVEDDKAAGFALRELLSELGANVVHVVSGEDALRLVLKQPFAAILLDVRLPGMDGYEVAAAIRSLERSRRTPIIFMSAEEDRRTAVRDGSAEIYLRKPLEPDVLVSQVARLLAEREMAA
jgi:CheY-like chemotaxis protein